MIQQRPPIGRRHYRSTNKTMAFVYVLNLLFKIGTFFSYVLWTSKDTSLSPCFISEQFLALIDFNLKFICHIIIDLNFGGFNLNQLLSRLIGEDIDEALWYPHLELAVMLLLL